MKPNLLGRLSAIFSELFMVPQPASPSRDLASGQIGIGSEILEVTSLRQRGRRRMDTDFSKRAQRCRLGRMRLFER
jgi:hypothetical protein